MLYAHVNTYKTCAVFMGMWVDDSARSTNRGEVIRDPSDALPLPNLG